MDFAEDMAVKMNADLYTRLANTRRLQRLADFVSGAMRLGLFALLASALTMVADWWLDLPMWVRTVALAANLACDGFIWYRYMVQPVLSPLDDDTIALRIEKTIPSLRSRLIAAVQLARMPFSGDSALVQKLVAETQEALIPVNALEAVRFRPAMIFLSVAIGTSALWLTVFQHTRPESIDLMRRFFLSSVPVPRKTRVECLTGNRIVALGDSLLLDAKARGIVPPQGTVTLVNATGREETFTVLPSQHNRSRFQRTIENVQNSFTYRVKLNDGWSDSFRIQAKPRPALISLRCTQIWPAYTGHLPTPRALGDLSLLAGSRLELEAVSTKTLAKAVARLSESGRELPLSVNGKVIRGRLEIPASGLRGFSVELQDTEGLHSKNEVQYRVNIVPDKAPLITLTNPTRREELVTASGSVLIGVEAVDDYGISDTGIHYKTDRSIEEKVITFDLESTQPKTLRRRYEWKMPSINPSPPEGTTIEFWIEAMDNNNVTGPTVTTTEHRFLKVVSEMEKRAELMNRLDEYLGQLGAIADTQQKLNQNLGEIIRQKPSAP